MVTDGVVLDRIKMQLTRLRKLRRNATPAEKAAIEQRRMELEQQRDEILATTALILEFAA